MIQFLSSYLDDTSKIITALSIILPTVYFLLIKIHKMYKWCKELSVTVNKIFAEFQPNGGHSLRDSINKIGKELKQIYFIQQFYFDHILDKAIFLADSNGMIKWVNRSYSLITKKPFSDILNNDWHLVVHADDRDRVVNEWEDAVKYHRLFDSRFRIVDNSGNVINIHCHAQPSESVGFVGFFDVESVNLKENLPQ